MAAPLVTAQQRAQQAAQLALSMMNARKPDIAIQECILRSLDPIAGEAVFAQPALSWPSTRASAYMKMLEEIDKIPKSQFKKKTDKKLLMKFLTEQLGIEGCKFLIRQKLNKDIPDTQFQVFHGPHVVNVMVKDDQPPNPTNETFVGEAKGGSSQLKGNQGTLTNLKKEAKLMSNSNLKSQKRLPGESDAAQKQRVDDEKKRRRDTGDEIALAHAGKTVTMITASTTDDPSKKPTLVKEARRK